LLQAQWPARLLELPAASRLVDEASGALMFQGIRVRMGVHTGFPNCRRNPITSTPLLFVSAAWVS
jgi:adenylate cyclase